jgi:hypothetical protein
MTAIITHVEQEPMQWTAAAYTLLYFKDCSQRRFVGLYGGTIYIERKVLITYDDNNVIRNIVPLEDVDECPPIL